MKNLRERTGKFNAARSAWWIDCQRALLFLLFRLVFISLFGVVWFHNRVPLGPDILGIILLCDVLYTFIYLACIYTYRVLLPLLLLLCTGVVAAAAAAVRHRVSDGKNCCWFIESDSIQCAFFLFKHDLCLMYVPLGSMPHLRPRFAYATSSVITGMRGARAGVSPPR